jgi:hypothetical protein
MGTIFCLRYEVCGRRKWETLTGSLITLKYALARAKMRESDLLTGAINDAKTAPVVPVATEPEKPARLTLDQAIDRYLRNASTKSPRTYHGYTYTMRQFRQSCLKQFLDVICEGVIAMTSYGFGRVARFADKQERKGNHMIFARIDTPADLCIERVRQRRREAGNPKPFDPGKLVRKYESVLRSQEKLREAGYDARILPHEEPLQTLLRWLSERNS